MLSLNAAAQDFEWVKSAGGHGVIYPEKIHVDAAGNTYATGAFFQKAKFEQADLITSAVTQYADIFLIKYDPQGKIVWAKRDGSTGVEFAKDVAVDAQGNIYVMGFFSKVFDSYTCKIGGIALATAGNEHEYFLAKYDAAGNLIWVRQSMNSGHIIDAQGQMTVDKQGNIIVQGTYKGEAKFGNTVLKNDGQSYSLFVAKYNPDGNVMWASSQIINKGFGESADHVFGDYIRGSALTTDATGNIYATGNFKGTLDFPGGQVKSQDQDLFLIKLDPNGKQLWFKTTGNNVAHSNDVEIDSKGNCYLLFYSSQPKIGQVSNSKGPGSFVAKFDPDGNAYQINAIIETGFCTAMSIGKDDRIYAIGHYSPIARVECVELHSTSKQNDMFFISQDKAGKLQWVKEAKGPYNIMTLDIQVDDRNNVYGLCYFNGDFTFGNIPVFNIGGQNHAGEGMFTTDMFLAKVNNIDVFAPPSSVRLACAVLPTTLVKNSLMLTVTAELAVAPVVYTWDMGNGEKKTTNTAALNYTYHRAGTYTVNVTAIDQLGCKAVCNSTINVSESQPATEEPEPDKPVPDPGIIIPNIFTPNSDGKNDVFTISNQKQPTPFALKIFNRYGNLIVNLEDGNKGWDGAGCADGLYFYHIKIAGVVKKGWVELIR